MGNEAVPMSRREALALLGAGTLVAMLPGCGPSVPAASAGLALAEPIYYSSVRALAQAIRNREVSSEEVVQACLDRIDRDKFGAPRLEF